MKFYNGNHYRTIIVNPKTYLHKVGHLTFAESCLVDRLVHVWHQISEIDDGSTCSNYTYYSSELVLVTKLHYILFVETI